MEFADLFWKEVISKRFNNPFLPKSIRGIIVGKSGCGKTTLLLNLDEIRDYQITPAVLLKNGLKRLKTSQT